VREEERIARNTARENAISGREITHIKNYKEEGERGKIKLLN